MKKMLPVISEKSEVTPTRVIEGSVTATKKTRAPALLYLIRYMRSKVNEEHIPCTDEENVTC